MLCGAYNDLIGKPTLFDGAFSSLNKPTTIAGYGITDALNSVHQRRQLSRKHLNTVDLNLVTLTVSQSSLPTNGSGTFTFVNQLVAVALPGC